MYQRSRFAALILVAGLGGWLTMGASAAAAPPALGDGITPLGAIQAGSKDGLVPAWDGGYRKPIPGQEKGYFGTNPFPGEKPLFTVTAKNYEAYAKFLSQGQIALLKKYPGAYVMHVYPSHRTAAAPAWVYANTALDAKNGKIVNGVPQGIYGGVPFPRPRDGAEVMWNHLLRWESPTKKLRAIDYEISPGGHADLISVNEVTQQMPYFFKNGDRAKLASSGKYWEVFVSTSAPPLRAGQLIDGNYNFDSSKNQAWVYLPGERRTRELPNSCCDTPTPAAANMITFDELTVFEGSLDRFNWKLLGKKEMIIPYNDNIVNAPASAQDTLGSHFIQPNYVRWEIHRVWEVEATLKPGKHDEVAKSIYYCDEDSWTCELADRWDAKGDLWRTLMMTTFVDSQALGIEDGPMTMNDLLSGSVFVGGFLNGPAPQLEAKDHPFDESHFTAGALLAAGID